MKKLVPVLCLFIASTIVGVSPCQAIRPTPAGFASQKTASQPACPYRIRQAHKAGAEEAGKFRKRHPSWTWPNFLARHSTAYKDCPPYVRSAYVKGARKKFQRTPPPLFSRP